MGSLHDSYARHIAAPMMQSQFGERDKHGALDREAVLIHLPGRDEPVTCSAIIGREQVVERYNAETNEDEKMLTRVVDIPSAEAGGVEGVPLRSRVEAAGKAWAVDENGSSRSPSWLRLQLVRFETVRENPMQKQG